MIVINAGIPSVISAKLILETDCIMRKPTKIKAGAVAQEGSLSEVNAYPRTVVEAALNYNAHSVILCHNHPGGSAQPSQADIDTTLILQELLSALGVTLLDHMVVAGDEAYSMMQHGDLDTEGAAARPVAADSTGRMAPKRPAQGTKAKEQRKA